KYVPVALCNIPVAEAFSINHLHPLKLEGVSRYESVNINPKKFSYFITAGVKSMPFNKGHRNKLIGPLLQNTLNLTAVLKKRTVLVENTTSPNKLLVTQPTITLQHN
ncbi:MAG: hypothetical protein KGZ88_06990, partial [Methylomicrobium sp.]|nr:hypothetical protein [Methylomicrobium sp.]